MCVFAGGISHTAPGGVWGGGIDLLRWGGILFCGFGFCSSVRSKTGLSVNYNDIWQILD